MNKQSKVFSIFIIVLILNIISNYLNFKIDLTEDKKYTLSENSKEILLNVDDIIISTESTPNLLFFEAVN